MKVYDYLVVGAGIFGATFARIMAEHGSKVLVIDKRSVVGGNCADYHECGITVHKYGAHIFHTNDKRVWTFVNTFGEFVQYQHNVKANYRGKVYSLPFNMNTFKEIFGVTTPAHAADAISSDISSADIDQFNGLEQRAIGLIGPTIFKTLVKEYTEKQWGKPCAELPASIIGRLPIRLTYDNNYFNDRYQGLPVEGYSELITEMLNEPRITVELNTAYKDVVKNVYAHKTLYCGPIDEFFDYKFGELEYRSLRFETENMPVENFQGCPVMNYTGHEVPYTRIIEHKHFKKEQSQFTVVTREYPVDWSKGDEPYYPVNDDKNMTLHRKYMQHADETCPDIIFGGRLGLYKYYDMDKAISAAMTFAESEIWR